MARLTKITRSNPLSSGTQVAPDAGGGFALFSTAFETLYNSVAPAAVEEQKLAGQTEGLEKGGKGGPSVEVTQGGGGLAPIVSSQTGKAVVDEVSGAGPKVPWLVHNNLSGKTRNQRISPKLESALSFLPEMGVTMHVGSGGQMSLAEAKAKGAVKKGKVWYLNGTPVRTGSTRHDHGDAADVVFYKDGKALRPKNAADSAILTEIVRRGKANGLTGFGEGDDYMGAGVMHVGFGAPAVWGAGGDTANAPAWLKEAFYGAGSPAAISTGGPSGGGYTPGYSAPTVEVRAADGKVELKQYSKFSGPILQAYNIAAQSAYHDTVLNEGSMDLAKLRMGHEFDPDGYTNAAQKYVDEVVKAAPDMLRGSIRSELGREVQRTTLGIMEAQQGDIRKRASNANRALIDRYGAEYEDALVAGDADAAASARQRLDGVLRVREGIPGSGWTLENSSNALFQIERTAEKASARKAAKELKDYTDDIEDRLDVAIEAAKAGVFSQHDGLAADPGAFTVAPETVRELRGFQAIRDTAPDLLQMTPDQVDRTMGYMAAGPVKEEWELDRNKAGAKLAQENRKAWEDDPVKRAGEVLETPPPEITSAVDSGDPAAIATALKQRTSYMNDLAESGYIDAPVYFDAEETELLKTAFGPGTAPEIRAGMMAAMVSAMGPDAVQAFGEIDGDPATMYAGKLMASGGSKNTSAEIIRGQALIDEGVVSLPAKGSFTEVFNDTFSDAFRDVPMPAEVRGEVITAARAMFAARAGVRGEMSPEDSKVLMEESVAAVLGGGKNKRGQAVGGVQDVLGRQTVLPPKVSGEDATKALERVLKPILPDGAFGTTVAALSPWGDKLVSYDLSPFSEASDMGEPYILGSPVKPGLISGAEVGIVAVGPKGYGLTFTLGNSTYDAEGPNGERYVFDLQRLIDATGRTPAAMEYGPQRPDGGSE